jgi:cell division septum initiation protein DivIVA
LTKLQALQEQNSLLKDQIKELKKQLKIALTGSENSPDPVIPVDPKKCPKCKASTLKTFTITRRDGMFEITSCSNPKCLHRTKPTRVHK